MLGGNRRKPRQFSYKPIYWDEEKEMRDELIRTAKMQDPNYKVSDDDEYVPGAYIRAKRMRRMQSSEKMQLKSRTTIIRVFLFLLGLGVVFFFLADYIAVLVSSKM